MTFIAIVCIKIVDLTLRANIFDNSKISLYITRIINKLKEIIDRIIEVLCSIVHQNVNEISQKQINRSVFYSQCLQGLCACQTRDISCIIQELAYTITLLTYIVRCSWCASAPTSP